MFGGYGFYFEDVFFAVIVEDGRLHFKADDLTVGKFEAAGAEQWIWEGDLERGPVRMNYWSPLGDVLEDLGVLETWVRLAVEAGRRGAGKKKKR